MNYTKHYFLGFYICAVFPLFSMKLNTIENGNKNDIAQDNITKLVMNMREIHNKIDADYLGVDESTYLKWVVGSWRSFCKSYFFTDEQAVEEMNRIESYITEQKKELALQNLAEKHWYVDYLLNFLAESKIKEFKNIKGSTIDTVYHPIIVEEGYKKIVYMRALRKYLHDEGLMRTRYAYYYEAIENLDNIHWAILYGHQENINGSLPISSDGNYLKSNGDHHEEIIWDIKQATKTNLLENDPKFENIKWISYESYDYRRYLAEVITKDEPAILLMKRPTRVSFILQQAFCNSKNDRQELLALRNSENFKLIQDFPKNNLEKRIRECIQELSSTHELFDVITG